MVAMALKEILMFSIPLLSRNCGFSKKPDLLPKWNLGLSAAAGASFLLPEHKANEGHVWIYLQNSICNRPTVEYLYTGSVGNLEKISLGLTLQFMFSPVCSILAYQSIMHGCMHQENPPPSWAFLCDNPCATATAHHGLARKLLQTSSRGLWSLYFHCLVSACIRERERPHGLNQWLSPLLLLAHTN